MMWRVLYPFARLAIYLRGAWADACFEAKERPWHKERKKRGLPDKIKNRAFFGFGEK